MKKQGILFIQVLLLIILLILNVLDTSNEILKLYFSIIFFEVCLVSLKGKFLSIYQIFLITLFFFNFARIYQDLFFNYDMSEKTLYIGGQLTTETIRELLNYFSIFCLISSIAFILNYREINLNLKNIKRKNSKFLIGIFFIFLIISLYNYINMIKYVMNYGYLSVFTGKINEVTTIRGVNLLSQVIFIILIYNSKSKKEFIFYALMILIFLFIPRLLIGQRGKSFTFLVYIIYLYNKNYPIKNKSKIFGISVLMIFFMKIFELIRYKKNINLCEIFSLKIFNKIFYEQSVSMLVPAYLLEYKEKLIFEHKYPYIYSYFIDYFKDLGIGQNILRIEKGNYLGDHLTYFISKNLFLKGAGTGTSMIAELLDLSRLNYLLFILFTYLFIKFSLVIEKNQNKNIFYFIISYFYLQEFIFSPRNSVFKSFSNIVLFLPFCLVIYYINIYLNNTFRRKNGKNINC